MSPAKTSADWWAVARWCRSNGLRRAYFFAADRAIRAAVLTGRGH